MFSFRRPVKKSFARGRHFSAADAQEAANDLAARAEALRLRDVDPVHNFTATSELRRRDPKYAQIWPSDVPHRRR
ncbi:UNVERIFIED_ORG: hypothetical protein ABIB19_002207 [Arthrobacter sp. UYEF10]